MDNFDDKYKKKNPFTVPDKYFDTFTDKLIDRIEGEKKPQKARLLQVLTPYLGLVAIFLLALFVVQVVLPHFIDPGKMLAKDQLGNVAVKESLPPENAAFDTDFNPTDEEIIEYLTLEVNDSELFYAELY